MRIRKREKLRTPTCAEISAYMRSLATKRWKRYAERVASGEITKSFGDPIYDPLWAAAQDLDLAVGLHLVGHAHYPGSEYFRDRDPGFMWVTMNVIQDPRIALATMVYDGVFDRFPRLRVATIEAMAGWVGEWLERFEYRYKYMKHTSRMKRSPTEYFKANIWVNGDPEERMFLSLLKIRYERKLGHARGGRIVRLRSGGGSCD